ncbi:hypothetical protein BT63DRAFT_310280 [Microthyrium microscopicum]|uniref:Uncharacterized protein n=1 Tax=Microthyrium microscopicum TaxID=703497 RepID=A0A6A6U2H4_9PEZI|nr:hypothetical protein BT63DRAFT_310280 [Microthyrium microscopicum]
MESRYDQEVARVSELSLQVKRLIFVDTTAGDQTAEIQSLVEEIQSLKKVSRKLEAQNLDLNTELSSIYTTNTNLAGVDQTQRNLIWEKGQKIVEQTTLLAKKDQEIEELKVKIQELEPLAHNLHTSEERSFSLEATVEQLTKKSSTLESSLQSAHASAERFFEKMNRPQFVTSNRARSIHDFDTALAAYWDLRQKRQEAERRLAAATLRVQELKRLAIQGHQNAKNMCEVLEDVQDRLLAMEERLSAVDESMPSIISTQASTIKALSDEIEQWREVVGHWKHKYQIESGK